MHGPQTRRPLRTLRPPMASDARLCQGRIMAHPVQSHSERGHIQVRFTLRRQMVIDGSTNGWLIAGGAPNRDGCGAIDTGAIGKTGLSSRTPGERRSRPALRPPRDSVSRQELALASFEAGRRERRVEFHRPWRKRGRDGRGAERRVPQVRREAAAAQVPAPPEARQRAPSVGPLESAAIRGSRLGTFGCYSVSCRSSAGLRDSEIREPQRHDRA
jgi:hypothetical protein